jgi:hypothetical protein
MIERIQMILLLASMLAIACLSIAVSCQRSKLAKHEEDLANQDKKIGDLNAEIERQRAYARYVEHIQSVESDQIFQLIRSTQIAMRDHASRIDALDAARSDKDTSDWLDIIIPDSIRMLFNEDHGKD